MILKIKQMYENKVLVLKITKIKTQGGIHKPRRQWSTNGGGVKKSQKLSTWFVNAPQNIFK